MADERKRRWWPLVILALLVLYPLSTGPAYSLVGRGYFDKSDWIIPAVWAFYAPLDSMTDAFPSTKPILDWHDSLWGD